LSHRNSCRPIRFWGASLSASSNHTLSRARFTLAHDVLGLIARSLDTIYRYWEIDSAFCLLKRDAMNASN